jgi:hypothetical protein
MTQHTQEPWPQFDDHPSYGKRLAFGNDAVILNRTQYNHARACVNACAGATDKQVQAIAVTGGIVALTDKWWTEIERHRQQREELLAALIYHQEQTRPIQRTIEAIAKTQESKA